LKNKPKDLEPEFKLSITDFRNRIVELLDVLKNDKNQLTDPDAVFDLIVSIDNLKEDCAATENPAIYELKMQLLLKVTAEEARLENSFDQLVGDTRSHVIKIILDSLRTDDIKFGKEGWANDKKKRLKKRPHFVEIAKARRKKAREERKQKKNRPSSDLGAGRRPTYHPPGMR
jgi:hypothetical protein